MTTYTLVDFLTPITSGLSATGAGRLSREHRTMLDARLRRLAQARGDAAESLRHCGGES